MSRSFLYPASHEAKETTAELFVPPVEIRIPAKNGRSEIIIRKPQNIAELLTIKERALEGGGVDMKSPGEKESYNPLIAKDSLTDSYLIQLNKDIIGYIRLSCFERGVIEWGKFLAPEYRGKGFGQVTFEAVLENIVLPAIGKKYKYLTYVETAGEYTCCLRESEVALKYAGSTVDDDNYPSLKVNMNAKCSIHAVEMGQFICRYPAVEKKREFSNKLLEICFLQSQISDIKLNEIAEIVKKTESISIPEWLESLNPKLRAVIMRGDPEKWLADVRGKLASRKIIDGTDEMLKAKVAECNEKISKLLESLSPTEDQETIDSLNGLFAQNNENIAVIEESHYRAALAPAACGVGESTSSDTTTSPSTIGEAVGDLTDHSSSSVCPAQSVELVGQVTGEES